MASRQGAAPAPSRDPLVAAPVALLALLKVALHLATAGRYGIFRDELYYIACARHLAWGYVDHPPLIAFVTFAVTHTLGTSLLSLRLLPALAGGALVWCSAQLARELGGGRFAQLLAAFAILPVPIYLVLHHWLTMNAFEPLLWTSVLLAAARMLRSLDARYWLPLGALVGIGLENKYSMGLLAVALLVGLLLTRQRTLLVNRWFAAGAALALLLWLPNLLWLAHHGFPFLEFERNSRASGARILRGPLAFLGDQASILNPLLAPLALAGLAWLLAARAAHRLRALGWAALLVIVSLLALQAKNYYLAPLYPLLLAAGAVGCEASAPLRSRSMRRACFALVTASGFLLAPLVMPILPIPQFLAYRQALGGWTPVRFENHAGTLPQYFSDEFGWETMTRETARVFHQLPEKDQSRTAIFANDYGEAAAIDFFGPRYGLPPSISKAETFWYWGPRQYTGASVLVLGSDGRGDREHFRSVTPVARVDDPYARADEHFDIFLCRDLNQDLRVAWPGLKAW